MNEISSTKEYQQDWAASVLRHNNLDLCALNHTTIGILPGDNLLTNAVIDTITAVCTLRKIDLKLITAEDSLSSADYVIDIGFCTYHPAALAIFKDVYERINQSMSFILKVAPKRVIILSDYRFFQEAHDGQKLSENEYHPELINETNHSFSFIALYEQLMQKALREANIKYIILRAAQLYAPGLHLSCSFLHVIAKKVAENQQITFCHNAKRYSFCHMGDFISAVFFAILNCPANQIYHVVSTESVSLEDIHALLYNRFPDNANIHFLTEAEFEHSFDKCDCQLPGTAMSGKKISLYGYKPLMELEQGLCLLVKSRQNGEHIHYIEKAYDGKLPCVKRILLQMLLEVDGICKKHHIQYFLAGGTLLGAVRHKGFIPWDDDVDIMMTRDQYETFLSVMDEELPDKMFYQTPETDSNSHYLFDKIRLNGTLLMTEFGAQFPEMHNGIFLDVIVQDRTARKKSAQKIHIFITHQLRKMAMNKWEDKYTYDTRRFLRRQYQRIKNFITKRSSFSTLEHARKKVLTLYANTETGWLYDGMGRNIEKGAFPEGWLKESIDMEFEGHLFPVPKEYDAYLTYLYGDYRQMPPLSQREISHDMQVIDLGEYYDF